MVFVLEGRLTLIDDTGETEIGPGEAAGFPGGDANAHRLVNRGSEPARYLEIGTRPREDRCHYAEHDLIRARPGWRDLVHDARRHPDYRCEGTLRMSKIFHLAVDDGIATITWDLPDATMNVLNEAGIRQLDALVDQVLADDGIKGAVITSGKPDFAGGMDLNVIAETKARAASAGGNPAESVFNMVMELHGVLRKIERAGADPKTTKGGKPFCWAAPGTAAGIGLELGLACHQRIASDNPKAKIGLPEIMVGIFPGAGGTTRLVRMLGLMGSAEALLQGKMYAPKKAKAMMLIDKVVPADELLDAARDWVRNATEKDAVKPWDERGYKLPGGGRIIRRASRCSWAVS